MVILEARGPILEAQGLIQVARGAKDFWDYCDFGGRSGAKGDSHFDFKMNKLSFVCSVVF